MSILGEQFQLLQAIIEGFVDGILILTERGEWVHANEYARRICDQPQTEGTSSHTVKGEIWRVCQSLIDSHQLFPKENIIIESEIDLENVTYRIRARWLELAHTEHRLLLVTLEDQQQSSQNIAIADAKKYGLTVREAEVWLLRRANYSYKDIAAKLYITLNTVKKHMKNIHAKQQAISWAEEYSESSLA